MQNLFHVSSTNSMHYYYTIDIKFRNRTITFFPVITHAYFQQITNQYIKVTAF